MIKTPIWGENSNENIAYLTDVTEKLITEVNRLSRIIEEAELEE